MHPVAEQLLLTILMAPIWVAGLFGVRIGLRDRHLGRPLFGSTKVDGTIVGHVSAESTSGGRRPGAVISFRSELGTIEEFTESPIRWRKPNPIGTEVRVSHERGNPANAKRYRRRTQLVGWLLILVSLPLLLWPLVSGRFVLGAIYLLMASRVRSRAKLRGLGIGASMAFVPTTGRALPMESPIPPALAVVDPDADLGVDRFSVRLPKLGATGNDIAVAAVVVILASLVAGLATGTMLWLLFPQAFLIPALWMIEHHRAFPHGVMTDGVVSRHERRRDTEGKTTWKQYYEFDVAGTTIEFERHGTATWRDKIGSKILVSYIPSDPTRARHVGSSKDRTFAAVFVVAGLVGAVAVHLVAGPALAGLTLVAHFVVRKRWARRLTAEHSVLQPRSASIPEPATPSNRGF